MVQIIIKEQLHHIILVLALQVPLPQHNRNIKILYHLSFLLPHNSLVFIRVIKGTFKALETLLFLTWLSLIN